MAFSGTRTRRCSRSPCGLTKACTVTSFGMSWGRGRRHRPDQRRHPPDDHSGVDNGFRSVEHRGQLELTTEKGESMKSAERKRNVYVGAAFVSAIVALGACQALLENRAGTGPTV